MIARADFLKRRKTGIGGSDVAAVLGLSKWKTPYQLWLDKTSDNVVEEESEILHFGQVLEQVVADEYARRNHVKVQRRNRSYRHPEHPELIGNIDRYIVGGGILECKTADKFTAHLWGENNSDEIPDYYLVQVQHYMHVTGYHEAALAVLIGGNEFRQYEVSYDKELAEFAAAKCVEFWQTFVVPRVAPPAFSGDDLAEYYRGRSGATVTAPPYIARFVSELKEVKQRIKSEEARAEDLAGAIKVFMGESSADTLLDAAGTKLATWKQAKDSVRRSTDWEALAAECGIDSELIRQYTTETIKPGSRPLLVK